MANLGITQTRVAELAAAFGVQKDVGKREMRTLMNEVAELRLLLTKAEAQFKSKDEELNQTSLDTARRLERTLDKLKNLSLIGRNFTGI